MKLIEKYVDFTIQLANVDVSFKQPFIVDGFEFDKFKEMLLIPEDWPPRVISINNLQTLHFFAAANIKILTHAISLLVNSDERLLKRCTGAVLQSFDAMDFSIKILTLKCLLEEKAHDNSDNCRVITQLLLQNFETLNNRIDQWNVVDEVDEFDKVLIQFLCDEKILLNFCEVTDDCEKTFDFCLALIERRREIRGENYEHLIVASYRCLRIILMKHITLPLINKINQFVVKNRNISKDSLQLLEYCVFEECKTNDSVYAWNFACELAVEILDQCDSAEGVGEIRGKIFLFFHFLSLQTTLTPPHILDFLTDLNSDFQ